MKKKSVFFVSVLCALMSFVFTGCKDEDENQLTVPTEVVTGVTFTDTDQVEGVIKGTLKWIAPENVSNITKYVIICLPMERVEIRNWVKLKSEQTAMLLKQV